MAKGREIFLLKDFRWPNYLPPLRLENDFYTGIFCNLLQQILSSEKLVVKIASYDALWAQSVNLKYVVSYNYEIFV